MKLILATTVPNLKGHKNGLFKREHPITPFVVCGVNPENQPMLECGATCYTTVDNPQLVINHKINKCLQVMAS
mgnify:CR=1 FL=1